jgi:uncharacterized protein YndB with AHSA1/START domain
MSEQLSRTYSVYVGATPERVWQALTDGDLTQQYYWNTRVESDWRPESTVLYRNAQGGIDVKGRILEIERPKRLVTTFEPTWAPEVQGADPSTLSWTITPAGDASRVTLTHAGFDQASFDAGNMDDGWVQTLSSLKSLLETGQPLRIAVAA